MILSHFRVKINIEATGDAITSQINLITNRSKVFFVLHEHSMTVNVNVNLNNNNNNNNDNNNNGNNNNMNMNMNGRGLLSDNDLEVEYLIR